jgi:UDPglucose 6-dehydrogenase
VSKICVIGTGYVGLSCGACLSSLGHNVTCVDINQDKIDLINRGEIPIMETGLKELVDEGRSKGLLSFTTDLKEGLASAEFIFLCLATPQSEDGSADLSTLMSSVKTIAAYLKPNAVVITKSTVPIGTFFDIEKVLQRPDVSLASNPEFVREGSAVQDFLHPDRIIVGATSEFVSQRVAAIYSGIDAPVLLTDPSSAEAIKHASNSFLAMKLSYINAIAVICELYGADVLDVSKGIGLDHRIGAEFLTPGPGWGGSCFPKDTNALLYMARSAGYKFGLLGEAIEVNNVVQKRIIERILSSLDESISGKRIAVWGLTFKANTDDLRDSPAIQIVSALLGLGAQIRCFDPTVRVIPPAIRQAEIVDSVETSCEGAELLLVLTEWSQFSQINPIAIAKKMTSKRIIDCRNILDPDTWSEAGFQYHGIGRSN